MLTQAYHDDRKNDAIIEIDVRLLHGETLQQAKQNGPYLDMDSEHRAEVDQYFENREGGEHGKLSV